MCTCWKQLQDVERSIQERHDAQCYLTLCRHGEVIIPVVAERTFDEEDVEEMLRNACA